ncbi:MAG TPA: AMP-binding protein [Xanthobacteraceae bacterium]|nr:AMP-binding protein [Xanthobacteraceae bacterium]
MRDVKSKIPGVLYRPATENERYVALGALTEETLVSAFKDIAAEFGSRVAVSDVETTVTYRELDELTDRVAAGLLRIGIKPLDRAIFQLGNSKELVIAYLACLKAAVIPICTLVAHRQLEIGYLGKHAGATAHFIDGDHDRYDFLKFAQEMRAEIPSMRFTVVARGNGVPAGEGFHDLLSLADPIDLKEARAALEAVDFDPWQVAIFQLSGGTTGVPKIIPRFHNEYLSSIRAMISFHGIDESIVAFTPTPMMHNAPMICYWGPPLFSGGEIAVALGLEPHLIGKLMAERKPNWICMPTVIYTRLKSSGVLDQLSFDHVKASTVPSGIQAIERLTGAPVVPLFGMTEGLICYGNAKDPREALETTVGRPVSAFDDLRLLQPGSEEEVEDGEVGELAIKGPCVIEGYFDAEERNREAFTSKGYYRSGDLCRFKIIDGIRYLTFEGRIKDVVSRGGEKINCMEVETVAQAHPKIASIVIVPMPDPVYEERACAFVVSRPGVEPITVRELGAFLENAGMAKFKWPERIEIVSDLPMTASGKVSKPKLKAVIAEKLKREADEAVQPRRATQPGAQA